MIETERLLLRRYRPDDLEALHALTEPEEMRRHLAPGAPSMEDSFARLQRTIGGWAVDGFGSFAIVERASGEYVGNGGIFRMVRSFDHGWEEAIEAGWIIAAGRWGQGYASEAMVAVHGWFDRAHGPRPTMCMIVPGNAASERLAAKLGYRPSRTALHKGDTVQLYERAPQAA